MDLSNTNILADTYGYPLFSKYSNTSNLEMSNISPISHQNNLESKKVNLIIEFINHYANEYLLFKYQIKTSKYFTVNICYLDFIKNWKPEDFLDQSFLKQLPSVYLKINENYYERNILSSFSNQKNKFTVDNIYYVIQNIIEEQQFTDYVKEVINATRINICNYIYKNTQYDCKYNCIGDKCVLHMDCVLDLDINPICYI